MDWFIHGSVVFNLIDRLTDFLTITVDKSYNTALDNSLAIRRHVRIESVFHLEWFALWTVVDNLFNRLAELLVIMLLVNIAELTWLVDYFLAFWQGFFPLIGYFEWNAIRTVANDLSYRLFKSTLGFVSCMRIFQTVYAWGDSLGLVWLKAAIKTIFCTVWNRLWTVLNNIVHSFAEHHLIRVAAVAIDESRRAWGDFLIFLARFAIHIKLIGLARLDSMVAVANNLVRSWTDYFIVITRIG